MDDTKLKYCRFCAEQKADEELLDLNVYSYIYKELEEKLAFFSFDCVDLSSRCTLPKTICFTCNTSLNSAFEFFAKVQRSQNILSGVFFKDFDVKHEVPLDQHLYDESKVNIKAESPFDYDETNHLDEPESELSSLENEAEKTISEEDTEFVVTYSGIPIFEKDVKEAGSLENNVHTDQSWSTYPWACKFCQEEFPDVTLLREHSQSVHDLCCAYKCADCSEKFVDFECFVEHARGHRISLRFYCQYCNARIENSPTDKHTESHRKKQKICDRCGQTFDSNVHLKQHTAKYKPLKRKPKEKRKKKKPTAQYVLASWEADGIQDKSWTGYPWTCQICNSRFTDGSALRSHTKEAHGKCFSMECADCAESMDSYRGFVYHVRKHRPFLKQFCHYCNLQFEDAESEQRHLLDHFSSDEKLCECCGEIFPDRAQLQAHITSYQPPKPKRLPYLKRERPLSIDDFTCDICSRVTKSVNALRAHKILHTNRNRDYTCDRCGKAFYTKGALSSHNIIHEETEPEVCKICKKTFKTLLKLKHHVLTHKGEKPFRCEVCNRCFRLKNQMVHHSIIHTNRMPFQCQYCDKAFRHKNNLKTHENQHTGARPYTCSDCGMDFTNWANCNKHMKRKHGTTLAKSTLTPQGKLPLNPKSGKPKKVREFDSVREWTDLILAPQKRGKKTKVAVGQSVALNAAGLGDAMKLLADNVVGDAVQ